MIQLPLQKVFTGDGLSANPQILTQLKRTSTVALYARASQSAPSLIYGYEVILVRVIRAGTPLPGDNVVREDYEQYPGAPLFGKRAWFFGGRGARDQAEAKYQRLTEDKGEDTEGTVPAPSSMKPSILDAIRKQACGPYAIPKPRWPQDRPFTIKGLEHEIGECGLEYGVLRKCVHAALLTGELVKVGTEKAAGRGKPATLYQVKGRV